MLVRGTREDDQLHGTAGRDLIFGYNGADLIFAEGGNDAIFPGWPGGRDWVAQGHDYPSGNVVYAGPGNDRVTGSDIFDWIEGGDGGDHLDGGGGNDALYGQDGDDVLTARSTDTANGGAGNDTIIFRPDQPGDNAALYGGTGDDTFVLHDLNEDIYLSGSEDHDTIKAGRISDTIYLQSWLSDIFGVEAFDFSGGRGSDLRINPQAVKDFSDTDTLTVTGDRKDQIDVRGWSLVGEEDGLNVYELDGARVLVDPDLALYG